MLPSTLLLAFVAAIPSTRAAAGHGAARGGHTGMNPSPEQAAALMERAAHLEMEGGMDAAFFGQDAAAELMREEAAVMGNATRLDIGGGKAQAPKIDRRQISNPKYVLNPKNTRTPRTTSRTAASTSTTSRTTTTTAPRTTTTTAQPSATGAKVCALTADCSGQPTPPNAHVWCDTSVKRCSWRCNKNYSVVGSGCVRADSLPTQSASVTTTTTTITTSRANTVVPTLPPQPTGNCQTLYRDTSAGAVYGPGIGTFPMLPRPSTFVTRKASGLYLDGYVYRIVGPSIYWLGLEENVYPSPSYPDRGRVREAMAMSVAMGANTIRAHTLGISTGTSLSVWPSAYATNAKAFEAIDYAIWAARNYGLRLIIPLTDEHAYYHGGKYDFIRWAGGNTGNGYSFYTNEAVIKLFKDYISVLLNHVNQYTGVAYKNDPTIMAWETGNELGAYFLGAGAPPAVWTNNIGNYIKSIAPNQLVADGTDGLVDYSGNLQNTGVAVAPVDIVTDHFYPALSWLLQKDAGWMQYYTKNFFVGEMDWTYSKGGDDPAVIYRFLEAQPYSGSMAWSLFGHDAQCCNWVYHNDGYSIYPPNGMSDYLQAQFMKLVQHWYRMRGLTPPAKFPAVACPQPELLK